MTLPESWNWRTLSKYIKQITCWPVLTREQESALFKRIKDGDIDAPAELVLHNLRFVVRWAYGYKGYGPSVVAELISEISIGLLSAAKKFDPERGVRFITYAKGWIQKAITDFFANRPPVRLPIKQAEALSKLRQKFNEMQRALGSEPTVAELANALNMREMEIQDLLRVYRPCLSLDAPIQENGDTTRLDFLPSSEETYFEDSRANLMQQFLCHLESREAKTLYAHFGFDDGFEEPGGTKQEFGIVKILRVRFGFDDVPKRVVAIGQKFGWGHDETIAIFSNGLMKLGRILLETEAGTKIKVVKARQKRLSKEELTQKSYGLVYYIYPDPETAKDITKDAMINRLPTLKNKTLKNKTKKDQDNHNEGSKQRKGYLERKSEPFLAQQAALASSQKFEREQERKEAGRLSRDDIVIRSVGHGLGSSYSRYSENSKCAGMILGHLYYGHKSSDGDLIKNLRTAIHKRFHLDPSKRVRLEGKDKEFAKEVLARFATWSPHILEYIPDVSKEMALVACRLFMDRLPESARLHAVVDPRCAGAPTFARNKGCSHVSISSRSPSRKRRNSRKTSQSAKASPRILGRGS